MEVGTRMSESRYTQVVMATEKTFYLETFGCQMNAHDSEKVIGTLQHEGYKQVENEEDAGLILYNTCSIRDKAVQKVFNRLNDYKKLHKAGKRFGVLGCVAQQEGEKIFERAPYVSLVAGSASYRKLPEMLARLEAGETRITGLDDRQTDETFETEFTARTNPYRAYITIIEGCDKFCAYCVVPYTRGKERSRSSSSVLSKRPRRIADLGYAEIQLLGQNVNSYRDPEGEADVRGTAGGGGPGGRNSPGAVYHQRIRGILRGTLSQSDRRLSEPMRPRASTRAVRLDARLKNDGPRVHAGVVPGADLLDQGGAAKDLAFDRHHCRVSRGDARRFHRDDESTGRGRIRLRLPDSSIRGDPTRQALLTMIDSIPDVEKSQRLQVLLDRQREIQRVNYAKHLGQTMEVMVEGANPARGQVSGRSSQNKPVNFTCAQPIAPAPGSYRQVRITATHPNSLVGEAV